MSIIADAALGARHRLLLVLSEEPNALQASAFLSNERWPTRALNFSERFAGYLDGVPASLVSQKNMLCFVRLSLQRRELVIANNLEPALALFADAERELLWNRLFAEAIDVLGMMVVVMRTDNPLAPIRSTVERFPQCVRGVLGALTPDHQLLKSIEGE